MKYIYILDNNNHLSREFVSKVDVYIKEVVETEMSTGNPETGETVDTWTSYETLEKEIEQVGCYDLVYEHAKREFHNCYVSDVKLEILNADNSFKYQVVDNELIESSFDEIEYSKPLLKAKIKQMCSEYISVLDWKTTRYTEQLLLVEHGIIEQPSATNEEYLSMIQEKQLYRDLSNIAEGMVDGIKTYTELTEAEELFNKYDFRDIEVVKSLIEEWSK